MDQTTSGVTFLIVWLDAWADAVRETWPDGGPPAVQRLAQVRSDIFFTAPELFHLRVRAAWDVYEDEGNTPEGRAAVALAYILQVWGRP